MLDGGFDRIDNLSVKIVWDEPKRQLTLQERRLDIATVTPAFFETARIVTGKKSRLVALNTIDGRAYAVVFQPLGSEAISIVTMRPASAKEKRIL